MKESYKSFGDVGDIEYYRNRIFILDSALQKATKEKNTLSQELEQARYELIKRDKEDQSRLSTKENELRRFSHKMKAQEQELKNTVIQLTEERHHLEQYKLSAESTIDYLFESYNYMQIFLKESINKFRDMLFSLG